MASDQDFVEFVADQFDAASDLTFKKMFGEYGLYTRGKFFAVVCDNRFFVKPTEAGRVFIGEPVEAPPYPGAKNYFLIEDRLEDPEWLCALARVTHDALPEPKPKKPKKPKKKE